MGGPSFLLLIGEGDNFYFAWAGVQQALIVYLHEIFPCIKIRKRDEIRGGRGRREGEGWERVEERRTEREHTSHRVPLPL